MKDWLFETGRRTYFTLLADRFTYGMNLTILLQFNHQKINPFKGFAHGEN